MKRDEHVNDIPDIEIVDLENETVQDTEFGKSDISDDFSTVIQVLSMKIYLN